MSDDRKYLFLAMLLLAATAGGAFVFNEPLAALVTRLTPAVSSWWKVPALQVAAYARLRRSTPAPLSPEDKLREEQATRAAALIAGLPLDERDYGSSARVRDASRPALALFGQAPAPGSTRALPDHTNRPAAAAPSAAAKAPASGAAAAAASAGRGAAPGESVLPARGLNGYEKARLRAMQREAAAKPPTPLGPQAPDVVLNNKVSGRAPSGDGGRLPAGSSTAAGRADSDAIPAHSGGGERPSPGAAALSLEDRRAPELAATDVQLGRFRDKVAPVGEPTAVRVPRTPGSSPAGFPGGPGADDSPGPADETGEDMTGESPQAVSDKDTVASDEMTAVAEPAQTAKKKQKKKLSNGGGTSRTSLDAVRGSR